MKILITGAISLSNKGTAAILISAIDELRKEFPNSEIFAELVYPEKQRTIMQIEKENVRIVESSFQPPIKGVFLFLLAFISFLFSKVKINIPVGFFSKKLKLYQDVDFVIDLSAEAFVKFYDESNKSYILRFLIHLHSVLIALFLRKPLIILAQTLSPFGLLNPIMKYVIKNAKIVTLRDSSSVKNLENEGIDTSKMHLTADPAFLLKVPPESRIKEILEIEKIDIDKWKKQNKKIIGVCTGQFLGDYENIIRTIAEAVNDIISKYDTEIIFISHSSGKILKQSDDVLAGLKMEEYIKEKEKFSIIKGDYTPQELKGIIGELDLLISLRMHPVIFAFSMGVPSVIMAFNDKAYGLAKKFKMEEYVFDVRKITKDIILQKVEMIFHKYPAEKKKLKDIFPLIQEQSSKNVKIIKNQLSNL